MKALFAFPLSYVLVRCRCHTGAVQQCLLQHYLPMGQVTAVSHLSTAYCANGPFVSLLPRERMTSITLAFAFTSQRYPLPDPWNRINLLFGLTRINLSFLSVSQQFPHFLPFCSLFISQDIVSPAIYFNFLHEVHLSKVFEHSQFISAFSDLRDLALPAVSSFSIRGKFLLTPEHFLWLLVFARWVKFLFLPFSPCACNTQENS